MNQINFQIQRVNRLKLNKTLTDQFVQLCNKIENPYGLIKKQIENRVLPLDDVSLAQLQDLGKDINTQFVELGNIFISQIINEVSFKVIYEILLECRFPFSKSSQDCYGIDFVTNFEKIYKVHNTRNKISKKLRSLHEDVDKSLEEYGLTIMKKYLQAFAIGNESEHEQELYNLLNMILLRRSDPKSYQTFQTVESYGVSESSAYC